MLNRRSLFKILAGLPFIGNWFKPKESALDQIIRVANEINSRGKFPTLSASDIVSVQPMTEPCNLIFELKYIYGPHHTKHVDPDRGIMGPKGCCT